MKILTLILACTAIAGAAVTTSCQGVFTKQDAAQIGAQIAKDSLDLAAKEMNGEPLNLQREVATIGLKAASSALGKVFVNLTTAAPTLIAASNIAQDQINAASVDDPQVKERALQHAADAVDAAKTQLTTATTATPSGK